MDLIILGSRKLIIALALETLELILEAETVQPIYST